MSLIDLSKVKSISPDYTSMDKQQLLDVIEYKDRQIGSLLQQLQSNESNKRTGHWETIKLGISSYKNRCSRCGYSIYSKKTNYCPDCGALMQKPCI